MTFFSRMSNFKSATFVRIRQEINRAEKEPSQLSMITYRSVKKPICAVLLVMISVLSLIDYNVLFSGIKGS